MTLDRIDPDGHYEPGNCRWATKVQQMRNKRTNRLVTIDGETRCVAEWAESSGLGYRTILKRLSQGWSPKKAISFPLKGETPMCPAGHQYSGENLILITTANGWKNRVCLACKRNRGRAASRLRNGVTPDRYRTIR